EEVVMFDLTSHRNPFTSQVDGQWRPQIQNWRIQESRFVHQLARNASCRL
ncbi:unnamed protein product, partial [Nesidiocoris tenuis]